MLPCCMLAEGVHENILRHRNEVEREHVRPDTVKSDPLEYLVEASILEASSLHITMQRPSLASTVSQQAT